MASIACAFCEEEAPPPVVSLYAQPSLQDWGTELPSTPLAPFDLQELFAGPGNLLPPLLGYNGTDELIDWQDLEATLSFSDPVQSTTLPKETLKRKTFGTGPAEPEPKISKRTPLKMILSLEDDPVYGRFYRAYQEAIGSIESSPQFQALQGESESVKRRKAELLTKKKKFGLTPGETAEIVCLNKKLFLLRQERFCLKKIPLRNIMGQYLAARDEDDRPK